MTVHLRRFTLLLSLLPPLAGAAQTCTPGAVQQAAQHTLTLQKQLLAAPSPPMDTDIPAAIQPLLHNFKQALIETVDTALRCGNSQPAAIQPGLLALLHANQPRKPFVPVPPSDYEKPEIGDYGGDLHIEAKPVPGQPNLFSITLAYAIACGEDNILLLYRRTNSGYSRELVFQNPDLHSTGDAVGDFFVWSYVPGPPGRTPLVALAWGTPWCTSRFSQFHLQLVAPAANGKPQTVLASRNSSYSRGDFASTLRLTPDGFEFRAEVSSLDLENVFTFVGVFRFHTTAGTLDRIEPVALNARDFVDMWLTSDWSDAQRWTKPSAPDAISSLEAFHERFVYHGNNNHDAPLPPNLNFGPVRACSAPKRFQVELDLTSSGKPATPSVQYAQVLENGHGYTMLAVTPQPDSTCTGPNLMPPRRK